MKTGTKALSALVVALVMSVSVVGSMALACDDKEANQAANAGQHYELNHGSGERMLDYEANFGQRGQMNGSHAGAYQGRGEHFAEVSQLVQDGDYEGWVAFMEASSSEHAQELLDVINEDNFYLLTEMMEAHQNGDHETAHTIREQLGLSAGRH